MAKTAYSPMEQWRGRVGSEVYTVQNGKQVIRNYTPGKGNPEALQNWRRKNLLAIFNMDTKPITVSITKMTELAPTLALEYSNNGIRWKQWGFTSTSPLSIQLLTNQRIYIRGINNTETCLHTDENEDITDRNQFSATGLYGMEGPILQLLGRSWTKDTPLVSHALAGLFYDDTNICVPPSLPSLNLSRDCYRLMFSNATSLLLAPQLPATNLSSYSYSAMFLRCTSLKEAPQLPATTLRQRCYLEMFSGCTSLQQAPELPATTLQSYCYGSMFNECTSLSKAPKLPAKTLVSRCYSQMFKNCRSLTEVNCEATNLSAENALYEWMQNVPPTGTFTKAAGVEWPSGRSGIPDGWTIIEE